MYECQCNDLVCNTHGGNELHLQRSGIIGRVDDAYVQLVL